MLKKILLAGIFGLLVSAAFAADGDFVAMTFNLYADGEVDPEGDLPAGMVMKKNIPYNNKKLRGHAHTVDMDISEPKALEQTFKVSGEGGELVISVSSRTMINGKYGPSNPRIKCTKMVVNGKPTKTPFVFNKWRYAAAPMRVKDGDTITVEAAFEKID